VRQVGDAELELLLSRRRGNVPHPRHLRIEARLRHNADADAGALAAHGQGRARLGVLDRHVAVQDALVERGAVAGTRHVPDRLWETGGSTSHAPGLAFQHNPSRTMTRLAQWTVELLRGFAVDGEPCYHAVGGIEVATTGERWAELHRRCARARGYGLDWSIRHRPSQPWRAR
jgi:hypothetical protein